VATDLGVPWSRIEGEFRVWSFHVYFNKLFSEELDQTIRFYKALVASSQPIRDRQKVIDWYRRRHRKRGACADSAAVPA
jgi:hypothetical protein